MRSGERWLNWRAQPGRRINDAAWRTPEPRQAKGRDWVLIQKRAYLLLRELATNNDR
jgi:hypothetical protein